MIWKYVLLLPVDVHLLLLQLIGPLHTHISKICWDTQFVLLMMFVIFQNSAFLSSV